MIDIASDLYGADTIEWDRVTLEVNSELDRILIREGVTVLLIGFYIQILAQILNLAC